MTHRTMLEPIVVEKPAQITPLEAALKALNADITSKHLYLEPAPRRALREYVESLDIENVRLTALLEVSRSGTAIISAWFNDNPAAYAAFKRSLDND